MKGKQGGFSVLVIQSNEEHFQHLSYMLLFSVHRDNYVAP
jgi:hypothetical protein